MHNYFFQLGNTPELSLLEIVSLVGEKNVQRVSGELALVQLPDDKKAEELIGLLGGTVKIIKEIAPLTVKETDEVIQVVLDHLLTLAAGNKIHFGFSELGRDHLEKIDGFELKSRLQQQGVTSRYVEGSRSGLSASILLHKKRVVEVYVLSTNQGAYLGQTVAIQDIDDWSHKDRNKPYFDRKKGMLPPKVALMMINIAVGDNPLAEDQQRILLDPFCGTGTIVMEALLTNLDVIGTDLDPDAVTGTKQNIAWLQQTYPFTHQHTVFISDATKIPPQKEKINYIVTEPFLGKPKPNPAKLPYTFKGLEKLYLGAFKHWTTLLADGASVVIVFPSVTITNAHGKETTYSLESLIDKLATFGYTTLSEPVLYRRPQAVVQRQIHRFRFNTQQ